MPNPPLTDTPKSQGDDRATVAWLVGACTFAAAGLYASAALLVDYVGGTPRFCDDHGGCGALREAGLGWVGPVPLPAIGLLGWVAIVATLLVRGPRARSASLALTAMGGVVAAMLIAVQIRLGVYCKYCMVVDFSMLAALGLAALRARTELDRPAGGVFAMLPATALFASAAGPLAWGFLAPLPVPASVRAELDKTPDDRVCVVDYVDFECPYCRRNHADMQATLAAHPGRARVVRRNVPLSSIHPHAMIAAKAACCADRMDRGDAMADALMTTAPEEFSDEKCKALAAQVGLDPARFQACMQDPATATLIDADTKTFRDEGARGLPTVWVGSSRIDGAQGPDVFRSKFERALRDRGL